MAATSDSGCEKKFCEVLSVPLLKFVLGNRIYFMIDIGVRRKLYIR